MFLVHVLFFKKNKFILKRKVSIITCALVVVIAHRCPLQRHACIVVTRSNDDEIGDS